MVAPLRGSSALHIVSDIIPIIFVCCRSTQLIICNLDLIILFQEIKFLNRIILTEYFYIIF